MNPPKTILLVDDDALIRRIGAASLTALGYDPATAADGAQAVARVSAGLVGAVILDDHLPDMSGPAVLEAIRAADPGLPVVLSTGLLRYSAATLERMGFSALLPKPYRLDDLKAVLERVV